MGKILTLTEIKAASDLPREEVDVPEWGGSVVVQGVSVADGMKLLKDMQGDKGEIDPEKAALLAFAYGVVEPPISRDDLDWLRQKSLGAVTRVTQVFMRLSGLENAALKEAQKNLSATGSGASS